MEMDLDDDLEAELVRRSSQKKVTKEVITEKNLTREEMEDQSRQAERESEQAKLPDSVDGWERALIASPNNSELWLRYAAHHITLGIFFFFVLIIEPQDVKNFCFENLIKEDFKRFLLTLP